ncbi:D-lactaldehyde dehydrogenase [Crucibulum laeve]|uniref:D-lactaldehyde dehydrogenase n=1 Tax=Crucibulum laeve TaxID=68775 RepID=A0A5C3MCE7_9AGAR|nr:D-lactaldehyde dehydrogenase [Crucibulum laeve]
MPTLQPPALILVSGANGYIAVWVVRLLLERGFRVRGTVRSESKVPYLLQYFNSLGYNEDKLEVIVVPDITKEDAFDEAVKGVDGIEHTASPFHSNVDDPHEFINPAVNGTVGILKSALKYGDRVKRIIVTSSCASVLSLPLSKPTIFSEENWNTGAPKEVEEQGRAAPAMTKYRASKVLAEQAAWKFYEDHKSEIRWDLSVINPPYVFGPAIQAISSPDHLNTSLRQWYDAVYAPSPPAAERTPALLLNANAWVDVRDIAEAHVRALEKEAAGGERIIVCGGLFTWQDWINTANALPSHPSLAHPLPKGDPSLLPEEPKEREKIYLLSYDVSKAQRLLDIKYKTMEETTRDSLEYFSKKGW